MKLFRTSQSYLEWEDYTKLIRQKEHLHFITSTAKQSFKNIISKEVSM